MAEQGKDFKTKKSLDEIFKATEKPLRMIHLYGTTQKVQACTDPKIVMGIMHEIKPVVEEALKDSDTKLEALYRVQAMQIHLDRLIIDGLKKCYISSLKEIRSEIDERITEINTLIENARPIKSALVDESCGRENSQLVKKEMA